METEKQVKTFNVFGYEIKSNSCTALDYNLYIKRFREWVVHSGKEQGFTLTMNHIEIWKLLDEAISVRISDEADTEQVWLVIETKEYKVSFKIPKLIKGGVN